MSDRTRLALDSVRELPARCAGRGYFLRAPADPSNWDVDTVRVDCRGCEDCRPRLGCTDGGCPFRDTGPRGMGTNGGCKCLRDIPAGIRPALRAFLRERHERLEAAERIAKLAEYVGGLCREVARHAARNGRPSNAPDPCNRCDCCRLRSALEGAADE